MPGNKTAGESLRGPLVVPGLYQARLSVGDHQQTQPFQVANDPRVQTSLADLEAQQTMLLRIRDKIGDAHRGVNRLRDLRGQVQSWRARTPGDSALTQAADAILSKLEVIEDALILPGDQKNVYALVQRPRLNSALASLISNIAAADAKPTAGAAELVTYYSSQVDAHLAQLQNVIDQDIAAFNRLIRERDLAPVSAGDHAPAAP
ncbi:MAG: hypothetical protein IT329_02620 [Caldilineaceae bacterium]|nr:hypothetical protein [Caldilineaceae bacterium]